MRNTGALAPTSPRLRTDGAASSRATASACITPTDAVSYTTPPNSCGKCTNCRIQSITSVSSSVAAGDVRHVIALTFRGAVMISPRIPGAVVVHPKYPRNIGCAQCTMPGTMSRSTSPRILSNGSACSGGCDGSLARIAPGLSLGATRSFSIPSRKSAIQSASACSCLRNSSGGVSPRSGCRSFMVFCSRRPVGGASVRHLTHQRHASHREAATAQNAKPKLKWKAPKSSSGRGSGLMP